MSIFIDMNTNMTEYIIKTFKLKKQTDIFLLDCLKNLPYLSLAGSTVLQVIQNEYYIDSDLDIYIDLNLLIDENFEYNKPMFVKFIIFLLKKKYNDRYIISEYNLDVQNILRKIYDYIENGDILNEETNPYIMPNKTNNILFVHQLYYLDNKIDIIFLKTDIHTHIINDYDLDIVKNYYNLGKIYCHNIIGIQNKIARLEKNKLKYLFLESSNDTIIAHWFRRYYKYIQRGFKIFIRFNVEIKEYDCDYILRLFQRNTYNTEIRGIYGIRIINNYDRLVSFRRHVYIYLQLLINKKQKKQYNLFLNYSYYLLDDYCNPNSDCLNYMVMNFDNDELMEKNKVLYLNSKKEIKFLTLK